MIGEIGEVGERIGGLEGVSLNIGDIIGGVRVKTGFRVGVDSTRDERASSKLGVGDGRIGEAL